MDRYIIGLSPDIMRVIKLRGRWTRHGKKMRNAYNLLVG
jgi:hypothetical protein